MPLINSGKPIDLIAKYLLGEYVDLNFSIVNQSIDATIDSISKMLTIKDWMVIEDVIDFKKIYFPQLLPSAFHKRKFMVWSPMASPQTTGFISNLTDGWYD